MVENDKVMLKVSHDEAGEKLLDRIKKGENLEPRLDPKTIEGLIAVGQIDNGEQWLRQANNKHDKWNKYNLELLKQIFSTNEPVSYYANSIAIRSYSAFTELTSKIRWLAEDINRHINSLESLYESLELYEVLETHEGQADSSEPKAVGHDKVFIVHGHDNEVKQRVARFIEKLGFESIILHEQPSSGNTIIEKIEKHSDVDFGLVLYTACDVGAKKTVSPDLRDRARQNVVFEHGYLIGKLGRENVSALISGDIEKPNDISGVVYISLEDGRWEIDLAKELKASGYQVDMNKIV